MTETPNPHIVDADTLTGEMRPIRRVVLALGSNLGSRMEALQGAVRAIADTPDVWVTAVSPVYETERYGEVPVLDATCVWDEEHDELTIFAINRDLAQPLVLEADLRGLRGARVARTSVLTGDPDAVNTAQVPDRVTPVRSPGQAVDDGQLDVELPPLSWNVIRVERAS